MRIQVASVLASLLAACATPQVEATLGDERFSEQQLRFGSKSERTICEALPTAAWVVVEGEGDCIRYYKSGNWQDARELVVYLHGDIIGGLGARTRVSNTDYTPNRLVSIAASDAKLTGKPAIYLARPGAFGSSGFHTNRRRIREFLLINGAIDQIKSRHRVERFHLYGHSGGSTAIAALLTMPRTDIGCIAMSSPAAALRLRSVEQALGGQDTTGHFDYYDPVQHVDKMVNVPGLKIVVLSDPRDYDVSITSQTYYVSAVKRLGFNIRHYVGLDAPAPRFHNMWAKAREAMRGCLS